MKREAPATLPSRHASAVAADACASLRASTCPLPHPPDPPAVVLPCRGGSGPLGAPHCRQPPQASRDAYYSMMACRASAGTHGTLRQELEMFSSS